MHGIFESISQRIRRTEVKEKAESWKSPMNSIDAAAYMMANFEKAKRMELGLE